MVPKISTLSGYIFEYQKSITNPTGFWTNIADTFYWRKKWDQVLTWDFKKADVKEIRNNLATFNMIYKFKRNSFYE